LVDTLFKDTLFHLGHCSTWREICPHIPTISLFVGCCVDLGMRDKNVNKYSALLFVMIFSFLFGDANVQIRLQNGQKPKGEFVGTYMNHVHILVEEKIIYFACDDIISITYADGLFYGKGYDYDCSKNTVTADILFPPELDPMNGEMTNILPDVFNPDIPKPAATDFDKLFLKDGTTYFGEYSKIEGEIVYFKPQAAFGFQPISIKQVERLELKCGHAIILGGFTIKEYQEKYKKHWKRLGCITKTTILGVIIYYKDWFIEAFEKNKA